jgi:F-type H+-transporting ATPase subunit b
MNLFDFDIPEWIFVAVNLLILVFVLKKILWEKVIKILDERQENIEKALENARSIEDGLKEMENLKAAFDEDISQQTTVQMQDARRRAGREYDRIVAEAESKARQIVATAQTQAERASESLLNDAKDEIAAAVLEMTGILLEANMDNSQNERLITSLLERKDVQV